VNSVPYRLSPHLSTTLKPCHPERSLAESEAIRQTQSKDPYRPDTARGTESNFRVVVRFFDENATENRQVPSREAAACVSPGRKPWVCGQTGMSPVEPALSKRSAPKGTAPSHKRIPQ
jgi:hypothetical protein